MLLHPREECEGAGGVVSYPCSLNFVPSRRRHPLHRLLKKYFIPHRANNYHPHVLHTKHIAWASLGFLALKIIVVVIALLIPAQAFIAPDVLAEQQARLLARTNEFRVEKGLPPLKRVSLLGKSAKLRADDMEQKHYFSHVSPDGHRLSYFLSRAGYRYVSAGENLAMGFSDADSVMAAWMKSPTHYANLIDPDYQDLGIGLEGGEYEGKPTVYIAQHFGATSQAVIPTPVEEVKKPTPSIVPKPLVEIKNPHPEPIIPQATTSIGVIARAPRPTQSETVQRAAITRPDNAITLVATTTVPTSTGSLQVKAVAVASSSASTIFPAWPTHVIAPPVATPTVTATPIDSVDATPTTTMVGIPSEPYDPAASYVGWQEVSDNRTQLTVHLAVFVKVQLAMVHVNGYTIDLQPMSTSTYAGALTVTESPEELFRTIIPPTVDLLQPDGARIQGSIDWKDPKVVSQTPWQRYLQAQSWFYRSIPIFVLVHYLYLAGIMFFSGVLLLNICIEIRKQHPHVIAQTVGLVGLLIVFWKF